MTVSILERPQPGRAEGAATEADVQRIFVLLAELPERDGRRDRLRTEIVRRHLRLVDSVARHYHGRGEPLEDIVGAGRVGLVKAVDRFDPGRGTSFVSYATCMIVGEIKRHFRDATWSVHVPRRLQELRARLRAATRELVQAGIAEPTHAQLAVHLGMAEAAVGEALVASNAYSSLSLDAPVAGEEAIAIADTLGEPDTDLERLADLQTLRELLRKLPERDRTIVLLRFYGNKTQSEIADQLGLSQMHVSRLLSRTLEFLRRALTGEDDSPAPSRRGSPPAERQTGGRRGREEAPAESPSPSAAAHIPPPPNDARPIAERRRYFWYAVARVQVNCGQGNPS